MINVVISNKLNRRATTPQKIYSLQSHFLDRYNPFSLLASRQLKQLYNLRLALPIVVFVSYLKFNFFHSPLHLFHFHTHGKEAVKQSLESPFQRALLFTTGCKIAQRNLLVKLTRSCYINLALPDDRVPLR